MTKKYTTLAAAAILAATASAQAPEHSGTLPVMYITTETPLAQIDRETNVTGTYYLQANGTEGVTDLGSQEQQLPLQLRGRGNYTWEGFDKKPLRLMLDDPQEVCGMKKSDYFGLFAHADDTDGYLRNEMGFELARRLDMKWTPTQQPLELYFNGEYRGMYFCTELVRVDPDRVNIYPQADNDDNDVTGGWMCEIDNYDKDAHIKIKEGNGDEIVISRKTPLELSPAQEKWLTDQMVAIDKAVYATDKTTATWAEYIDIDELAKFYIVNEIMDDYESFHGSCYLYHDRGTDAKWIFGPVWDFGSSFKRSVGKFIWKDAKWSQHWIGEMYKFPQFQQRVREIWADFCRNHYATLPDYVNAFTDKIRNAAIADTQRWPKYGNGNDLDDDAQRVIFHIQNKSRWLGMQWGTAPDEIPYTVSQEVYLRGNFNNWETTHPLQKQPDGTYTLTLDDISKEFKIADADWADINYGSNGTKLQCGKDYKMTSGGGSDNIEIYGGIKNATVTYNPEAETVRIDGMYYPIQEETVETPVYFRGDINGWGKSNQMEKGDDGKYTVVIENLTRRFKIADADYKKINLGGDGTTLCQIDQPYPLKTKGSNITMAEDVDKALVTYDPQAMTVTVTRYQDSGVETIATDNTAISALYTIHGIKVPAGTPLAPGIYITVNAQGKAQKHIIR